MQGDQRVEAHAAPGRQARTKARRRPIDCGADDTRISAAPHAQEEISPETIIPARGCCTDDTRTTTGRAARTF